MLEVLNLSIKLMDRYLVKDLNFILNEGDKLAIIGEEGNGKSTLLKAIACPQDIKSYVDISGTINTKGYKIGYLPQFLDSNWDECLGIDYFTKENYDAEINYDIYAEIGRVQELFAKFNLNDDIFDQKIKHLSGGEKVKIQLIKLLFDGYDILLLDEPTNDLDINTLEFLEDFINESKEPIIYITHDEVLLERTANSILHMEQIKAKTDARNTFQRISFIDYREQRDRVLEKQAQRAVTEKKEYKEAKQTLSNLKSSVRSKQEKIKDSAVRRTLNKKMKSIIHQEKKVEDNILTEMPDVEDSIYSEFSSSINIPNNKVILDFYLNELSVANKVLSKDIKLTIKGPKKLVISGSNGSGKTTLLKKILENLKMNNTIKVGYMPQNYDEVLKANQNAIEYLKEGVHDLDETTIRAYMGNMKFTTNEMTSQIRSLSGGQKAKLLLLNLILNDYDVIVLDEPTRNLSPLSNPAVREMLKDYNGGIISVSHDRKYIQEVCDKHYELTELGLIKVNNYKFKTKSI